MGLTQKEVIDAFAHCGIQIKSRRLTEWRQQGLLPKLEEVRNAHGRVEAYVWNQANIVEHVGEVWLLCANHKHARRLAHFLWLLGYGVRPDVVMECIRAPVESYWQVWSGGIPASGPLFDALKVSNKTDDRLEA